MNPSSMEIIQYWVESDILCWILVVEREACNGSAILTWPPTPVSNLFSVGNISILFCILNLVCCEPSLEGRVSIKSRGKY